MEVTFSSASLIANRNQTCASTEPLLLKRRFNSRHQNPCLLSIPRPNKFVPLKFAPTGHRIRKKSDLLTVLSAEKGQVHVVEARHLVGLAGPPGAGKSTLAHEVAKRINKLWSVKASSLDSHVQPLDVAVVVPMDGFHLYRSELDAMENPEEAHARRGAPWTFNPSRLLTCLKNLRLQGSVYAPSFDHGVGDPVEDDIFVNVQHKVVIVEGNYLLLEDGIWKEISSLFDEKWFIDVDIDKAMQRVLKRHISTGKPPDIAKQRVENNDRLNAELVMKSKKNADIIIKSVDF